MPGELDGRVLRRIGLAEWAGCALVGGLVALCAPTLRTMPTPVGAGAPLLAAGVAEAALGSWLRARVRGNRIGFGPGCVPPVFMARAGAVAAASALVGIFAFGFWAAFAVHAFLRKGELLVAARSLPGGLIGAACSLVLVAGAFWLRRCCRSPDRGYDDPGGVAPPGQDL